ncbi:anaerobic ribonucleoside-triphosphate reductase [Methanolobus profundi]|uniref:Ribonucleoside-triphosphate reductase class III catalytic subunit n=1 Tax=Methanolobus profundi TaxID=487685 RepID=A0A1I4QND1_9EURY|nr:anaerobic ribonucleoside-triphosphate reductase [Methanolobus profundi]SFM41628.1 ribonucleoside-triphosphate reductase class III catalytic subunit [Methanolobus profundi]
MEVGIHKKVDRLDFRDPIELVDDVLLNNSWLLKENSNTRLSPSVVDLHIAAQIKKQYALKKLYSGESAWAHLEGLIHIHDLHSPFTPYCNGIDARIFLKDGLRFPDTVSLPAKRFESALYHAMSFMVHSQQFFAGAQAIDMLNWMLAPHLHFDDITEEHLRQIVQGFMFQMNQSNRIGAQSAFTNIGLRITCPKLIADQKAIFAGKELEETYSHFEDEARTIYKAIMEIARDGDGQGCPFTFPLITTAITDNLDLDDPLWELTMQAAASTGAPYFLNLRADYLSDKTVHAMCCRLFAKHSGGIWNAGGMGSGSNKVVSINLPGVSLRSRDMDEFFEELDKTMDIARQALLDGNRIIERALNEWKILPWLQMVTDDGLPYYDFEERHLTFGVVGLNECLMNLTGETLLEQQALGIRIIRSIAERIEQYSKEDKIEYTLEQTPAESTAHRFALIDRLKYKEGASIQGTEETPYYTNSTHVPYRSNTSLINRIEIESEFHPWFTGGTISHIWMGESHPDPKGLSDLVEQITRTKIAYFCFSPDLSICSKGHSSRGIQEICPHCQSEIIDHISRVTGYYGHVNNWNPGKIKEYQERHRYTIDPTRKDR